MTALPTEPEPLPVHHKCVFNMSQTWPLFVYFRSSHNTKTNIAQI